MKRAERPRVTLKVTTVSWQLVGILCAGLVFRLALLVVHGRQHDLETYEGWTRLLATTGTSGFYGGIRPWSPTPVNAAPGFALILLFIERIYELVPAGRHGVVLLGALLRVPAIFADLASAAICYSIVIRYAPRPQAVFAAGIATFAPWTWPLSAIAGSYASICTMFLLLALDCALDEKYVPAWLALGVGALVGPLPLAAAPLLLAAHARDEGLSPRVVIGPLLAVAIAYVAALPFAPSPWPLPIIAWLTHVYGIAEGRPMTSFEAPNVWFALVAPMADTHRAVGIALRTFGWLAFAAAEVMLLGVALRRMFESNSRLVTSSVLVVAWFATMLAAFTLTTRMHAADLAYALAVAPTIWAMGLWQRRVTIALTVTFCAGVLLSLAAWHGTALGVALLRFVAIANVAILGYVFFQFSARDAKVREDWGGAHIP